MRLLTWNINGIRTLPQYHPWNKLKTGENILNELGADIICFQETKSTRLGIEKSFALPVSYDAFYSFPTVKGGYSGVSIYTRRSCAIPLKAEEGLTGALGSGLRPPMNAEERVSTTKPLAADIDLLEDAATSTHMDISLLDQEGRALMLDFGLFVLINLYCPNETSDARLPYKMNFHLVLAERIRKLVEVDEREVIVTGDINICAEPIDHCDGEVPSVRDEFFAHPARKWFHEWLSPRGPMVDVVREVWPDRKGMYTCWNQKISARVTNYGTRIDYFLLTKGLLPWFKHGDIQASVKGSDHCPVYIDLHDEIQDSEGRTVSLRQMMKMDGAAREPPRIATKFWGEFSGKQKLLSNFFARKVVEGTKNVSSSSPTPTPDIEKDGGAESTCLSESQLEREKAEQTRSQVARSTTALASTFTIDRSTNSTYTSQSQRSVATQSQSSTSTSQKRKAQADSNYPQKEKKKLKQSSSSQKMRQGKAKATSQDTQSKISSFFKAPKNAEAGPGNSTRVDSQADSEVIDVDGQVDIWDNTAFIPRLTSPITVPGTSQKEKPSDGKGSTSWSQLFTKLDPPRCSVHNEPTREYTVNKPGINKGRAFFVCARPVGPGYDAGREKRKREEVDPQYRCNFFKWSSDWKRERSGTR